MKKTTIGAKVNSIKNIYFLAQLGILTAIIVVLAFTPLGFIPVGPLWATIIHIPVIIGAIVLGPYAGAILGFVFGLCSILKALSIGDPIQIPIFVMNPQIALIPRILIGITAGYSYRWLSQKFKTSILPVTTASIIGTATNSVLVILGIYIFTPKYFALSPLLVLQCIVEAVFAVVLSIPICKALSKLKNL